MSSLQRALAILLVVGTGIAAGFISYQLKNPRPRLDDALPLQDGAAARPGDTPASAAAPEEEPVPTRPVPTVLPDVTLPDLAGQARSLRSFSGRPLIVNFWATWCEPCRREIPLLRDLRQRHRDDRVEIVGIAIDFASAVNHFVHHTPIDYPLLVGEQEGLEAAQQFGVQTVLPFSVFADAAGGIVAVKVGELHREEAEFILAQINEVDRGQIGLPAARERIEAGLRELAVERAKAQQKGS